MTSASRWASTSFSRSCVIGRADAAFCSLTRIAAASGWPIQIGEEAVAVGRLQEHDRLLADHVEADPVDDHLAHRRTSVPVPAQASRAGVSPSRLPALTLHGRPLAGRPRVARGRCTGHADARALPPPGRDVQGGNASSRSWPDSPGTPTSTSTRARKSPRSPATSASCLRWRTTFAAPARPLSRAILASAGRRRTWAILDSNQGHSALSERRSNQLS